MAENENVKDEVVEEQVEELETTENATETPEVAEGAEDVELCEKKESKLSNVFSYIKEKCRKFVVKLKRRPMNIAFFVLIVSSLIYLLELGNFSQTGLEFSKSGVPISIFVNTLFCILVLLLFMYSFPKREKKPKVVMLVLTFVFMAVMITLDILLYVNWSGEWAHVVDTWEPANVALREKYMPAAIIGTLLHAVFVAVAALLTATYPLYGKLINKINTKKEIASTDMKEEIDTSEEG